MARVNGMWIKVEKADIDKGTPNHPTLCPVARALRRVLSGEIEVDGRWVWMSKYINIELPNNALDFIGRFDDGIQVRPFKFFLPLN